MPREFIEVRISAAPAAFETMTGVLAGEGFEGFWEEESLLRAYAPAERWREETLGALAEALERVTASLDVPPPALAWSRIADENWNRRWEESIRPLRVSRRIVIAPSWHPYTAAPGEIVLTIDPKMSFGTGHHETTRLMLGLLETHCRAGAGVLDAGTGTGVIAIAALKLGASSAIGFDTDDRACENAEENARLNGVADRFIVRHGDLSCVPEQKFDLVCANIQLDVIQAMLPGLARRLAPGGKLLASGLLAADRGAIGGSLAAARLPVAEERSEGEWLALAAGGV